MMVGRVGALRGALLLLPWFNEPIWDLVEGEGDVKVERKEPNARSIQQRDYAEISSERLKIYF